MMAQFCFSSFRFFFFVGFHCSLSLSAIVFVILFVVALRFVNLTLRSSLDRNFKRDLCLTICLTTAMKMNQREKKIDLCLFSFSVAASETEIKALQFSD